MTADLGRALAAGTLAVRGITVRYGGVTALEGVDLDVAPGRVVGLIGPNGAGKTTLVNAMTGVVRPASGTIALGDARLEGRPPHRVARAGLARTYQNVRLFARLDVGDNVRAGAFRLRHALADADVVALLARALVMRPKLLVLDEPSMGLAPKLVATIFDIVAAERARGTSILLVEQNARKALALADRAYVMVRGEIALEGSGSELASRSEVADAYLGHGPERDRLTS
ncbi:MAG: ABC transporter ATP-binding protein [Vulcanimicrobiaceae bacterium]